MSGIHRARTTGAHRGRLRRSTLYLALASLILGAAVIGSGPASGVPTNPYLIDGSVPDAGVVHLADPEGSTKELGPENGSDTKIGVIHDAALPMLERTNPNAQVDLRDGYVDIRQDSDGNAWAYIGWFRDSANGSGFISFEFMKNAAPTACETTNEAALIAGCNPWANRTAGDFIILWDQQGGSTAIQQRTWSGPDAALVLGTPVTISAATAVYGSGGFAGEAAINLTAAGLVPANACLTIANVIPGTVTGNSDTADYKDTILQLIDPIANCTAEIVTTPLDADGDPIDVDPGISIGSGVVEVQDKAVITLSGGSVEASGSLDFYLCAVASGTCDSGGTFVGSTPISDFGDELTSPSAWVTATGRYCWRSEWEGDASAGIPPAEDSSASECFVVTPAQPTLTTDASDSVTLGGSLTDSATLSGTATQPLVPAIRTSEPAAADLTPAGGTITFVLKGPGNCTTTAATPPAVTVSGDDTYHSASVTPTQVGDYDWVATYTGSSPNTLGVTHNASCTDGNEAVSVTDVASSMTTAQTWVPNDSATFSAPAGGTLSGTASFALFASADCSGTAVFSENRAVSGPASGTTVSTTNDDPVSASGSYSWLVSYDSTNSAQRDIPASCHETSALTITNGGSVSSP